jgi:hypothetical protein
VLAAAGTLTKTTVRNITCELLRIDIRSFLLYGAAADKK